MVKRKKGAASKQAAPPGELVRSLAVPAASPQEGITWEAVWGSLGKAWRLSTDTANWAGKYLLAHDVQAAFASPDGGKVRLPAMPRTYLYGAVPPELKALWEGGTASLNCVLRAAERAYRAQRWRVLVAHDASPCHYRYPYPLRIHNQNWSFERDGEGVPYVTLPLPGLGRVRFRLRAGRNYARQLGGLDRLLDGTARAGELLVCRGRADEGDHRGGRDEAAGRRWQVLFRFGVRSDAPAADPSLRPNTVRLFTCPEAMLVCELNGGRAWVLNDDHAAHAEDRLLARLSAVPLRWRIDAQAARVGRLAQDCKAERRSGRNRLARVRGKVERVREAHERFMKTYMQQTASMVARFCERAGVGTALLDIDDRGYARSFPYFRLREAITHRLQADGVLVNAAPEERARDAG